MKKPNVKRVHKLHRSKKMKTVKLPLGKFLEKNELVPVSMAHGFVNRHRSRISQIVDEGLVMVYVLQGVGFLSLTELNRYLSAARPGRKPGTRIRKKGKHYAEQKELL
jgi:hypothetical protein